MTAIWHFAVRLWYVLPVVLRALIIAELVVDIGGLPPDLFLFGNLKLLPGIPWCLPLTLLWLWGFWVYVGGRGWPRANSAARRRDLRADRLTGQAWTWALIAGGLGMLSVVGVSFLTLKLADLPADAYRLPVDLSRYPSWTVASALIALSVSAGVVQEVGYRGYMLSQVQRRHGWVVGILFTGLVFFFDHHFSHAYATYAFLPFFMLVSTLHGLLIYFTRSILPSILLHAVADAVVIPIQYGIVGHVDFTPVWKTGVDQVFIGILAMVAVSAILAIPAFWQLASITRESRASD